jgi:syntaxin 1B/2/3
VKELAKLFTDMDDLVSTQAPVVIDIDKLGDEVNRNTVEASRQIGNAVESSRSRNRKKWWCMLVVILIIVVVIVATVTVTVITQKAKRA